MIKKTFIFGFLLAFSNFTAQAYAQPKPSKSKQSTIAETIKFGPHFGVNFFSKRPGGYFEYKLADGFGVQSGIYYFYSPYVLNGVDNTSDNAIVTPKYIALPLVARGYSGEDGQFALFAGIQTGYLIGGEKTNFKGEVELADIEKAQKDVVKVSELKECDNVNSFDFSLVTGFDYEANIGLIWGITYTKGLLDIIKSDDTYFNWSLQLVFGFNFGKFLS